MDNQPKNPLHGITLEQILVELEQRLGWKTLGEQVKIKCFTDAPSIKSSLKFLRKPLGPETKLKRYIFIQ